MNRPTSIHDSSHRHYPLGLAIAVLSSSLAGCASTSTSGVAVGRIGAGLARESSAVPQGAEVCAYQDALATPNPGGPDKPTSEICSKALKSDRLWQRAMIVLGAYASKLQSIASGGDSDTAGVVEGALTHVNDESFTQVESSDEGARTAVAQLASQLKSNASKGDLSQTVKDAAPQVKTICDGLGPYLDAQIKAATDAGTEIEKKRAAKGDRRCVQLDGKSLCVGESVLDRMSYASAYADLHGIEVSHQGARETLTSFCAAHEKLASAAANGDLSKDQTFKDIVDAAGSGAPAAAPAATPAEAPKPSASEKPATDKPKK